MRAHEFLIEYNPQITKQKFGDKLLDTFRKEPPAFQQRALGLYIPLISNANDLQHQQIIDYIIKKLETMDPTAHKEYVPWLAKMYINQNNTPALLLHLEDMDASAYAALEKFHKLKQRKMIQPPNNDINRYKTFNEFETAMDKAADPFDKKEELSKGEGKIVYEDPTVKVIKPANEDAACYYGQGTRWCTAATKGKNYFSHYHDDGPLYILFPKKPNYAGEKYQFHFESNQFKDPNDDDVDLSIMFKRFPGFFQWIKDTDPDASDYLIFVPDEAINKITKVVAEKVKEYTYDTIMEWETEDEGFRDWQAELAKEKGYVDADGDVDWDRVNEDDTLTNYAEYNDDARILLKDAALFSETRASDVKDARWHANIDNDDGSPPKINDLVDAYAYLIDDTFLSSPSSTATRKNPYVSYRKTSYETYGGHLIGELVSANLIIVKKDYSARLPKTSPYKLVGNAGDYDVYSRNFGIADVRR